MRKRLKNRKMRLFLLLCALSSISVLYAQKKDSDFLVDSIKKEIIVFFVDRGDLSKDVINKGGDCVFAVEMHEKKLLGYNDIGIYHIGVFQSHTEMHILIKEETSFKLYNLGQIDIVLKAVIEYSIKHNLNKNLMLFYVKEIIALYDSNATIASQIIQHK